ncbi:MAG: hypothetical protein QOJ09_1996 [Actinomycetota bacterium]|nr:hypothetical protein [Actinomycetota bacterium]
MFAAMQLVPYGWSHTNPPVTADAPWPSPAAERIARQSCYECHSNETTWPVYAYVAPMSWLARHDVDGGRDKLNFSTWSAETDLHNATDVIRGGSMPPLQYTLIHPAAKLTAEEKRVLVAAIQAMDQGGGNRGRGRGGDGGGD